MPTATKEQKVQKIRNAEYYDFQGVQDTLYTQSKENKVFRKLMTIILSEENIMLAYRNIKKIQEVIHPAWMEKQSKTCPSGRKIA